MDGFRTLDQFHVLLYLINCQPTCRQHSLNTKDRHYTLTKNFLLCILHIENFVILNGILKKIVFRYPLSGDFSMRKIKFLRQNFFSLTELITA